MSIRIGVEKQAEELGMNIIKSSQIDNTLVDNVHGVTAVAPFVSPALATVKIYTEAMGGRSG